MRLLQPLVVYGKLLRPPVPARALSRVVYTLVYDKAVELSFPTCQMGFQILFGCGLLLASTPVVCRGISTVQVPVHVHDYGRSVLSVASSTRYSRHDRHQKRQHIIVIIIIRVRRRCGLQR